MNETPDPSISSDVFIGHAGDDHQPALELQQLLEKRGWRVFLDVNRGKLELGQNWDDVIPKALKASRLFVPLISSKSGDAHYLKEEIAIAVNLTRLESARHRIVAVTLEADAELPYGLQRTHSLDVTRSGGLASVAEEISNALTRFLELPESKNSPAPVVVDLSHGQVGWQHLQESLDQMQLDHRLHVPGSMLRDGLNSDRSTLILPLPFHVEWTRTEIQQVESWVRSGGGLLLLGYYAADLHHATNPSQLAGVFGLGFGPDLLLPAGSDQIDTRRQVWGESKHSIEIVVDEAGTHPILNGVRKVSLQSACSIRIDLEPSEVLAMSTDQDVDVWIPEGTRDPDGYLRIIHEYKLSIQRRPVWLAAHKHGKGRILAIGSWKILKVDEGDNRRLVQNMLAWLGQATRPDFTD